MPNLSGLGDLPSVHDVQDRINQRFDELFHYYDDGTRAPYVCSFCDEFLLCPQETSFVRIQDLYQNTDLFEWTNLDPSERIPALEEYYRFNDRDQHLQSHPWVKELALSPRGVLGKKKRGKELGFSSCNDCKNCITKSQVPFYAIINHNYVGCPPSVLTDLTEVELAFITPVKGYGYVFKWAGGPQKKLQGHLTFMRVEERKIVHASAQLEGMGLTDHVFILITGKMTERQRQRARLPLRTNKILAAVEWLVENHSRWKGVDLDSYRARLANFVPHVIDDSTVVASENQNIESEELFKCYYPDGAMNENDGGFDDSEAFKSYVNEMKRDGFDLQLKLNLSKDFIEGKDGDQLISSSLLQFPYGRGGLRENRTLGDGTINANAQLEPFMAHLSRLAQPIFQLPLFTLIIYSLTSKLRLLKRSRLQLRSPATIDALANGLLAKDVTQTIQSRRTTGSGSSGSVASRALLNAVDCMSAAVPQSNEAAKKARRIGESMQHHFGMPSLFLTMSFDDENSLLMQTLSNEKIDDEKYVIDLPDEELAKRGEERKKLRIKFPGIGALSFEMQLQIAVEELIGWDMRRNTAWTKKGLFGLCKALTIAMEEQGRESVHAHFGIWIEQFDQVRHDMFFGSDLKRREANATMRAYSEHVCTTELFSPTDVKHKASLKKAFAHECKVDMRESVLPSVVDLQDLRNLRHRHGYKTNSEFATCPKCYKEYTYEDLVGLYCEKVSDISDKVTVSPAEPDVTIKIPKARMAAMCVEFQKKKGAKVQDTPTTAINAFYNSHASCHVNSCFKCQKNKETGHACGPTCECRYRLPDRARKSAVVRVLDTSGKWYEWNGNEKLQPQVEVLPKRNTYDLFQNVSCKAVSESKFTCNSNISIVTDGPIGMYIYKYILKPTQDDDTAAYSHVERSIQSLEGRVHDDDKKEAIRRVCRAAFAHNKQNIIGAPLASYLTRHDSRFYFSHSFQFCPIQDLQNLLHGDNVSGHIKYARDGRAFFENQAIHYLCRPECLKDLSAKTFYENYQTVQYYKQGSAKEKDLRYINDTGYFRHPSAKKVGRILKPSVQGCYERDTPLLIRVSQWQFPDTATFKGNILTCPNSDITDTMEQYAELVLLLYYPYRSSADLRPLQSTGFRPFTMKLREVNASDHIQIRRKRKPLIFSQENTTFLQNIQNSTYNSLRYKVPTDDLQSETTPFVDENSTTTPGDEPEDVEQDQQDDFDYDQFLNHVTPSDVTDLDPAYLPEKLQDFPFSPMRNKGAYKIAYSSNLPIVTSAFHGQNLTIAQRQWVLSANFALNPARSINRPPGIPQKPTVDRLVTLYLSRSRARARPTIFDRDPNARVSDANGTLKSLREWSRAAKLDKLQSRAFEAITASFVLTFFELTQSDFNVSSVTPYHSRRARAAKSILIWTKGGNGTQLIMLLHGPGGSGKSTVISLVLAYAKEYCDLLGHPFTIHTIVVTAMSGVAATLIHGTTAHKTLGLMKKRVSRDMPPLWEDTRLLFVDECSFAPPAMYRKIEQNCRDLMPYHKKFLSYGGLNVVYAGDFSQLEPPCQPTVYGGKECPAFHSKLNSFIELNGQHRYSEDPEWGRLLSRFRAGKPTLEDIRKINDECLVSPSNPAPLNVQMAVHRNANRDALNAGVFEEFCEANEPPDSSLLDEAILVLMDNLFMHDDAKTYVSVRSNEVKKYFYANCGEDNCKTNEHNNSRVDPVLKLYPGCPVMLTDNSDVANGQANGSRLTVQKVFFKAGERPVDIRLECGTTIRSYFASQIGFIRVRHVVPDIVPREFDVYAEEVAFRVKLEIDGVVEKCAMKGNQFPLISNSATTGHKLQGCTLHCIYVFEWHYANNWPYVVLSRVRKMSGLFIHKKLKEDVDLYKMPKKMLDMIQKFKDTISIEIYSETQYDEKIQSEDELLIPDMTTVSSILPALIHDSP